MKLRGRTDPNKVILIRKLKKASIEHNAKIWKIVAEKMEKANRKRTVVNISRLNRYTTSGETVLVPGKLLGAGTLDHSLNVAAESFSQQAREKVEQAGGVCLNIDEILSTNPEGSNIRIFE